MKKLTSLRQYLIDACPALQRDPDQLITLIDSGSVRFHVGESLSHLYDFRASVILTEFGADVDTVTLPLLHWLSIYQPDLQPEEAITFESEILKNDKIDLLITVQLTERVTVAQNEDGHYVATHHEDPREIYEYGPTPWDLHATDETADETDVYQGGDG
jgi:hypothetical protein